MADAFRLFLNVTNVLQFHTQHLWGGLDFCFTFVWFLFDFCLNFVWILFEFCLNFVWFLFDFYFIFIWNLYCPFSLLPFSLRRFSLLSSLFSLRRFVARFWKRRIVDRFNIETNCVGNGLLAIVLVGSGGCACFGAQLIAMHVARWPMGLPWIHRHYRWIRRRWFGCTHKKGRPRGHRLHAGLLALRADFSS